MYRTRIATNHQQTSTWLVLQESKVSATGFFDDACYQFYLRRLRYSLNYFQVQLHAYALLPDRIWLLLSSRTQDGGRALLAGVNRTYKDYFNTRFARSTCPWTSLKQIPVKGDAAVLISQKLVERAPLHSGLVQHVGVWHWTSYRSNAFGGLSNSRPSNSGSLSSSQQFVTRHGAVTALLRQTDDPGNLYRTYLNTGFGQGQYEFLCSRIRRCQPLSGLNSCKQDHALPVGQARIAA